ncbi:zinc finger protein 710 isoform X2 [Oncorhynchus mykiss]|uniref:zinc finger protein 710 isoform X2 n=1 Tax=Oncorhynchus mykiss TaxID=8022 RepID=UPI0018787C56|nr:zinc finger protein 710 isoform X2 [Oncorhynchus mykiss]
MYYILVKMAIRTRCLFSMSVYQHFSPVCQRGGGGLWWFFIYVTPLSIPSSFRPALHTTSTGDTTFKLVSHINTHHNHFATINLFWNQEEASRRLVRCEPREMARQVDSGTQTDPVVVLSLAQAAVLGLISQNEVFGATIAPNGFYTGEPKESPALPVEGVDYEYADQLIGANGDYLGDNLPEDGHMQPSCSQRRWHGPPPEGKMVGPERHAGVPVDGSSQVKGEGVITGLTSCVHMLNNLATTRGGLVQVDPASLRAAAQKGCAECDRDMSSQQANTHPHTHSQAGHSHKGEPGHRGLQGQRGHQERAREEEEEGEQGNSLMKGGQEETISSYFQSSEVGGYEGGEIYHENSQGMMWGNQLEQGVGGRGVAGAGRGGTHRHHGRRVDRLDINIQIDESYCVDMGEGLKRWKCRMCEKSYTSKYNLVTHILGHQGIKPHACPHCGKLFKQPSHLQTHLLTHQGTRPHKCTVCKKGFTQTSHLKRHMLQHTDVKPYSCRFCRRGFAYPSELRAHETKHERGRCHVCSQCGMEFPTYAHLKRHQTSHQGPTSYQCTECNKSFTYRSQLQNHLLKHQSPRPYSCSHCGLEFVQLHHLRQHALTHKVCGKSFNRMYNLLGHMHLHAGSKPFKCPYCSSKFNLKGNLSRHMKVKHGMDISPDGQDALPEMEGQGHYEEDNFDFGTSGANNNMDNGGSQNLTKLTTANMDDMDNYYNFGKDTANYNTS